MLVDRFGRVIKHLRISVTSRCNLNCLYCHREGEINPDRDMNLDEIKDICWAFYKLGVEKVKVTGGEPLVRRDIVDVIADMPPFREISLVTNGTLLSKLAFDLKDAGLSRVNISLDTLDEEKYRFITGGNLLKKVVEGVYSAYDAGLKPIKLNMVVMRGINENEIEDLLDFASKFNRDRIDVILQLIELVNFDEYYVSLSEVEERFKLKARKVITRGLHARKQYVFENKAVEFVRPFHKEFCMHCTRISVTSDGKIKPCLLKPDVVNARGLKGKELEDAIRRAVDMREPYVKW